MPGLILSHDLSKRVEMYGKKNLNDFKQVQNNFKRVYELWLG